MAALTLIVKEGLQIFAKINLRLPVKMTVIWDSHKYSM